LEAGAARGCHREAPGKMRGLSGSAGASHSVRAASLLHGAVLDAYFLWPEGHTFSRIIFFDFFFLLLFITFDENYLMQEIFTIITFSIVLIFF
jgi:hypothetical protein